MIPKDIVNDVLRRDMDRRQFLKYIGLALLAFVGITRFLKALSAPHQSSGIIGRPSASYGGNRQSALQTKGRKN
jgi:hypothetical protein